jgi:hypothetical protein
LGNEADANGHKFFTLTNQGHACVPKTKVAGPVRGPTMLESEGNGLRSTHFCLRLVTVPFDHDRRA